MNFYRLVVSFLQIIKINMLLQVTDEGRYANLEIIFVGAFVEMHSDRKLSRINFNDWRGSFEKALVFGEILQPQGS